MLCPVTVDATLQLILKTATALVLTIPITLTGDNNSLSRAIFLASRGQFDHLPDVSNLNCIGNILGYWSELRGRE
jgi:hypothetical protein